MDEEIKELSISQKKMRIKRSDRLSDLPDSILIEILSELDAHELIRTGVLSKRWSKLWTFVPCLDFDYFELEHGDASINEGKDVSGYEFEREETSIIEGVSKVLHRRDDGTDLHTFRIIQIHTDNMIKISETVASSWFHYALTHNLKKLDLSLVVQGNISLPGCLFTCESLEDVDLQLVMDHDDIEIKPDEVRLPKLRRLRLCCAYFEDAFMEKLLAGCPVLESLELFCCTFTMKTILFSNLKHLGVNDSESIGDGFSSTCRVSAPGLQSFEYEGDTSADLKFEDMSTVTKALLNVFDVRHEGYNLQLLSSLSGVENLEIGLCEEMLREELVKCPTFKNLKKLTIHVDCMYCSFTLLLNYLKKCSNLEFLTLNFERGDFKENIQEEMTEQIESFACNRLKKIEIFYEIPNPSRAPEFSRHDNCHVYELVRLLLKSTSKIADLEIILSKKFY